MQPRIRHQYTATDVSYLTGILFCLPRKVSPPLPRGGSTPVILQEKGFLSLQLRESSSNERIRAASTGNLYRPGHRGKRRDVRSRKWNADPKALPASHVAGGLPCRPSPGEEGKSGALSPKSGPGPWPWEVGWPSRLGDLGQASHPPCPPSASGQEVTDGLRGRPEVYSIARRSL